MPQDGDSRAGKVLHVIDSDGPGGAETIFVELVLRLEELGWESLATVTKEGWSSHELRRLGVEPKVLGNSRGWDLGYLWRLWSLIQREQIDLVQAHLLGPALYGSVAAQLGGVRSVATFHGGWDLRNPGVLPGLKLHMLEACLDSVVFVSAALRREFDKQIGSWAIPTAVIPNGIEVSNFGRGRGRGFRTELGLCDDHFLVGTVGNVRPAKSHGSFLQLADRLRDRDDRYRFVLVGDTSSEAYRDLRTMRDRLGLEDRFTFTGYREDVANVMESLDVFVLTSRSEGFSLTTVEAMASGLPVVATRCGGPEEIVEEERTGLLVDVGDLDAMVRRVEELRRSPSLRKKLGSAARQLATRSYSVTAMLNSYDRLYRSLLGEVSCDDGDEP